jgi:hypothetical protein
MSTTKSLLQCAVCMYLPFYINTLAFHPAIHRKTKASYTYEKTQLISNCPFFSITNWLKAPLKINNSSNLYKDGSVQYGSTILTGEVRNGLMTIDPKISLNELSSITWTNRYRIHIEKAYRNALSLRCPFFRRRATDILEFTDSIMRHLLGKRIALLGPAIALRGIENGGEKRLGLSLKEIAEIIRKDWREENYKGYYVTGRLTANIYRDDCLFDGPDPDMPVRGVRKYVNAASQLFEYKSTTSELLSLQIHTDTAIAKWRFNGTMRLPWKPKLPQFTGTTIYYIDSSGLIYKHIETWDISVCQAFVQVFFPKLSQKT